MGRYDETKIGYMDKMFSDLSREEMFDVLMDKHETIIDLRKELKKHHQDSLQVMFKDAREIRRLNNKISDYITIAFVLGLLIGIILTQIN